SLARTPRPAGASPRPRVRPGRRTGGPARELGLSRRARGEAARMGTTNEHEGTRTGRSLAAPPRPFVSIRVHSWTVEPTLRASSGLRQFAHDEGVLVRPHQAL